MRMDRSSRVSALLFLTAAALAEAACSPADPGFALSVEGGPAARAVAGVGTSGGRVIFTWPEDIIVGVVNVEECTADCDTRPVNWCFDKTADNGAGAADVWQAGYYHHEPRDVNSSGASMANAVPSPLVYGDCPEGWDGGETMGVCPPAPALEEDRIYAVGLIGFHCTGGVCDGDPVMACRLFRIEDGNPVMMAGTSE